MAYRYLAKTEEKGNSASMEPKGVEVFSVSFEPDQ